MWASCRKQVVCFLCELCALGKQVVFVLEKACALCEVCVVMLEKQLGIEHIMQHVATNEQHSIR